MELEGLRGIAAVVVVLYHNLLAFYAFAFFGLGNPDSSPRHEPFEVFVHGSPFAVFLSGTFAVAIFFVLSGFVLSIGYVQTKRSDIIKNLAAKRYLRLMLPALASILLCYVLLRLGLSHAQAAGAITQSGWLLGQWNFAPNLLEALKGGLFGIFVDGMNVYNNVLWTMTIEFAGSFIVFGSLLLFGKSKYRWIVYSALLVVTFNTWYLAFILGMIFAELYVAGYITQRKRNTVILLTIVGTGLVFGGFPFGDNSHSLYSYFGIIAFKNFNYMSMSLTLGAALLIFAALWSSQFAGVLRKKYISGVGKYTFALYLVHIPILYSYTTWAFIHLSHHMGYNKAAVLSLISSVPIVVGATYLFERYVDKKSVKFATYCADIFYGKRLLNIKKIESLVLGAAPRFMSDTYKKIKTRLMPSVAMDSDAEKEEDYATT